MRRYKICVYAICKDEEQFVDRWMDAVKEADMVVVLDTGSSDATAQKLRARGATVYEQVVSPWRFDTARNIAMDHIPADFDICVSNDIDEVFEPGWRDKLEESWQRESTRARYLFVWSHAADGSEELTFPMSKIHRRKDFRWAHPVHEILEYSGSDPESVVSVDGMVLHHYPDDSKPRTQYLPLLELSAEENPEDNQTMFWLGREYMFNGMNDEGIATLRRHLCLPSAQSAVERSASMRYIASCHQSKGDMKQAREWLYRAIAECPYIREPFYHMAMLGYFTGDWPLVRLMAENALAIVDRRSGYLEDPKCWGHSPYDLAAIACERLGMYQKSHAYAVKALEMEPNDERLAINLEIIREKLNGGENSIGDATECGSGWAPSRESAWGPAQSATNIDRALAAATLDLGLMRSAAAYRLDVAEERAKSAVALTALFEELVLAAGVGVSLEIGAFDAAFSRRIKQLSPATACLAYEANPYNFRAFAEVATAGGVTYLNKGVGAVPGRLPFRIQRSIGGRPVPAVRGNNSFLARTEAGVEYFTEDVELTTIDAELAAFDAPAGPDVALWIDVEGFAGPVLSGARRAMTGDRIALMMIELEDVAYWDGQLLSGDIVQRLMGRGLIPVARDFEYVHQYNVVFVHHLLMGSHLVRAVLASHFSREANPSDPAAIAPARDPANN